MSLLIITVQPRGTESHFDTTILLDGRRFRFSFYTNTIDQRWYMDVANDDESSAARGIPMSNGTELLYPYRHLDIPQGKLFISTADDGDDPDLEAFADGRATLFYDEVAVDG